VIQRSISRIDGDALDFSFPTGYDQYRMEYAGLETGGFGYGVFTEGAAGE
jgi:hypothetical protein